MTLSDFEFDHEEYHRDRWLVWREWAASADMSPSGTLAAERLKLLGVITGDQHQGRAVAKAKRALLAAPAVASTQGRSRR